MLFRLGSQESFKTLEYLNGKYSEVLFIYTEKMCSSVVYIMESLVNLIKILHQKNINMWFGI